jgi:DNA-binding NarL/FixJ family response regulator
VIALIADGCTNREIGGRLKLAEKTVKNNVSSILAKLNVVHRSQAAAYPASHTATPEG